MTVVDEDRSKDKYQKLLAWFKIAGMKSSDFCLSWDNLFIPGDMILNKAEKMKKEVLVVCSVVWPKLGHVHRGLSSGGNRVVVWSVAGPS